MRDRRITKLVEGLLMKYQNCRDSDKDLIIGVLQAMGAELTEKQRDLFRKVNFESIRRTRQKLQEEGKYLPSPAVAKKRRLKAMIVQQNAPSASADYMQELVDKQPQVTKVILPWGQG